MRCFLAIELDEEINLKINEFKKDLISELNNNKNNTNNKNSIKFVEDENLHITVKFLGDISEKQLEDLKKVKLNINKNITVKGLGLFPNKYEPRVLWVGISDLEDEFKEVDKKLSKIGFKKQYGVNYTKKIISHLTIGRIKNIDYDTKKWILEFVKNNKSLEFGSCNITKISLKKSTLTPNGPIYETVYEYKNK
ncbi:RNA 2',3'-cyclic phosphodiesterase [Methanococcus voltae]|uniref:RNA 2',3'-cyclic phosphodiesterase n=2 Tax=Methanococcus voltae TaxID=2188 RepID=A0A8J7S5K4_METVO|nr:RNA 2',3'-cyclic phosphodiesterase [Methanococcus voltae]MBP2172999.1 2'-5' RNA ligase [Methanococcus voltae]MBP2201945.1 2'-5' RNA ligase [Methanococcus voltae]MCS3922109.1 2'-5' RNA ligase [Methanococcus voltae PS]